MFSIRPVILPYLTLPVSLDPISLRSSQVHSSAQLFSEYKREIITLWHLSPQRVWFQYSRWGNKEIMLREIYTLVNYCGCNIEFEFEHLAGLQITSLLDLERSNVASRHGELLFD